MPTDLKIQKSDDANPWTNLNLYNDSDNFQFVITADRTGGMRPGVFKSAAKKINLMKPEFVVSIGDQIEGNSGDDDVLDAQWDEFDNIVNSLDMPFFYLAGNHDISNVVMEEKWRQRLGKSYYHFVYKNVLFLCLNTGDPPNTNISPEQIEYFQKVLRSNKNVRWTLVFMHKPLWKKPYWKKLESHLAERPYTVFAGHDHTFTKQIINSRKYYTLASTGASKGSEIDNFQRCKFDHIVWITMTEEGPVLANLLLTGILDDEPCGEK